jgi:uncharacterized repeat protein (TIGR03803 family)
MRLLLASAAVLPTLGVKAGAIFTTLHAFQVFTNGAVPEAALVLGNDGNFYGTTAEGGTNGNNGTVFRISTNGEVTSLYSFFGGSDGGLPEAGLVLGNDGNFYGTTAVGGMSNAGTVFKISTNGVLTSLHLFSGGSDGANPSTGLIPSGGGDFYGANNSTVFQISTNGTLRTLYTFPDANGTAPDGGNPSDLILGRDGNLFGTTQLGGSFGKGTVFTLSTSGVLRSLYSFTGGKDGGFPTGLEEVSEGNFYGTTGGGGAYTNQYIYGAGTVFKTSTNGNLTTLYSFTGGTDGAAPGHLVLGGDGSFYGTTQTGGAYTNQYGQSGGTVFRVSNNGMLDTLYSFMGNNDGAGPYPGLVQGSNGIFYGTTQNGGANGGNGTVFQIGPGGAFTSLYSFTCGGDGANPRAGLVQGADGNFYGTTEGGGTNSEGNGTVFQISANGALTTLYSFTGGDDGASPWAGLVQASDGDFYGTTPFGGASNSGTVFRISTNGMLTSLYSFSGSNDGANPQVGLALSSDGDFYGTTFSGGITNFNYPYGNGTVFKIATNGELTTLYSFTGGNDDRNPEATLVQGIDGNFYGATRTFNAYWGTYSDGTVFKISTNGTLTTLYAFGSITNDYGEPIDGEGPSGLVQGTDGFLYGTTAGGGTNGYGVYGDGTVFKLSTNGTLASLYLFTGGNDGGHPLARLLLASDGNFYGTTAAGGSYTNQSAGGTVFKISTNGTFTTLYSFDADEDGSNPMAALVQGSDGRLYGTTYYGGEGAAGTVFRLTIAPEFQALTLMTNNMLNLTWSTEAGGMYQLQYNSDLSSSNWINLGPPIAATGATLDTPESVTNGPQRFYRLMLSP